jgi:hypothetical protein
LFGRHLFRRLLQAQEPALAFRVAKEHNLTNLTSPTLDPALIADAEARRRAREEAHLRLPATAVVRFVGGLRGLEDAERLLRRAAAQSGDRDLVLAGFDCEWKPTMRRGTKEQVAVLQVC